MMKKIYGSLLMIWLVTSGMTYAFAEEACDNAVDAADSMDLNQKECDYSDKGLNGFLQKAFKKGNEGAVLSTSNSDSVQPQAQIASTAAVTNQVQGGLKSVPVLSVEVDQWANVALAKNQLLPKIMERCTKGFSLLNENYRSLPMGRIELSLHYSCL
ncbi:MAG TPA: hypothetical protein VF433_13775 [Cellvibrio sp.]